MSGGTDRRLRGLARRGQGDFEAEVELLAERVRRGEVPPEGLRLAAYLGHPAACALAEDVEPPEQLEPWLLGLCADFGLEARNRAWFSLVWTAAPSWWLSKRCKSSKARVDTLAKAALQPERKLNAAERRRLGNVPYYDKSGLRALLFVGNELVTSEAPDPQETVRAFRAASEAVGEALVTRSLERDLATWALRRGDPIAARRDPLEALCDETRAVWRGARPSVELLLLRARFGDLQLGLLEAAAQLGSLAAREAVEWLGLRAEDELSFAEALVALGNPGRLSFHDEEPKTRKRPLIAIAAAVAEQTRAGWEARNPGQDVFGPVLEALRAWMADPTLSHQRDLSRIAEVAYEQDEPAWSLYRAALSVRARDPQQVAGGVLGALRWLVALRLVEAAGEFDYKTVRQLESDRLDRLDDAELARLGLSEVESILDSPVAAALRAELADGLLPYLLTPTTEKVRALHAEWEHYPVHELAEPEPPQRKRRKKTAKRRSEAEAAAGAQLPLTSPAWEAYAELDSDDQRDELAQRLKDKAVTRKQLRLAALLDHAPAADVLAAKRAPCPDPLGMNAIKWAEELWRLGGAEAWGRAILSTLDLYQSRVVRPMRDALTRWLVDPRNMALEDLHALARAEDRKVYRGEDRDPSAADELRDAVTPLLLSVKTRRTQAVANCSGQIDRERACRALLPWALGLLDEVGLAVPEGIELRPYRATETFTVGEWVQHKSFGRGQVVSSAGSQLEILFEDGETRKLAQAR